MKNKPAMLVWIGFVLLALIIGFATTFIGLVLTMPVSGHATWRGYKDTIDAWAWPPNYCGRIMRFSLRFTGALAALACGLPIPRVPCPSRRAALFRARYLPVINRSVRSTFAPCSNPSLARSMTNFKTAGMIRIAMLLVCAFAPCLATSASPPESSQRAADFQQFCDFVRAEYAHFDIKATDWSVTCGTLKPMATAAGSRDEFVATLETTLGQLYDTHAHLGTNTRASLRLVPTNSQLRLAWRDGRAIVTDVRQGSAAHKAGIRAGDELLALDDIPIETAVQAIEPRHLSRSDPLARDWALDAAVAGRHERDTRFSAADTGGKQGLLEARRIDRIGYVRIHNSLGADALVPAFDKAIGELAGVTGFILDLRDTPSGGTSSVARGIMGHFVSSPSPYQRHEYVAEGRETGVPRVWVEYVSPRPALLDAPVVVLVGAWTGSMGEGIAIGLNAARASTVLGQRMAQLLGAMGEVRLTHSGIVARIPNEKLFHVNGTPREKFLPQAVVESAQGDSPLEAAKRLLAP
jgi:C-terminal processing protease CtpA/Prc